MNLKRFAAVIAAALTVAASAPSVYAEYGYDYNYDYNNYDYNDYNYNYDYRLPRLQQTHLPSNQEQV